MWRGNLKAQWDVAVDLKCLIANLFRDPDKQLRPYYPWDFHPLREREEYAALPFDVRRLKALVE